MSNYKHAYGWSGHVLAFEDFDDLNPKGCAEHITKVTPGQFAALKADMEHGTLPEHVGVKMLGRLSDAPNLMAVGHPHSFSEAFWLWSAINQDAEDRIGGGNRVDPKDNDAAFLDAIKAHYGITLGPCRQMLGMNTEA